MRLIGPRRMAHSAVVAVAVVATIGAFLLLAPLPQPSEAEADPPHVLEVDGVFDAGDDEFRLRLSGEDLALLVRTALEESPTSAERLSIDVEDGAGESANLRVRGSFDGSRLPVRTDLEVRRSGAGLEVSVLETRVAGLALPDSAAGALEDLVDDAADLGGLLADAGVELSGLEVEDSHLVLTGRADNPDAIAERLRAAARQRGAQNGAREAPEERLGRGRVRGATLGGDFYLALGDSITAATGVPDSRDGFSSRLHAALEDRDRAPWGYLNLGIPGATARSTIDEQLEHALRTLGQQDVALVTLTVGSNELLALLEDSPCARDLADNGCERAVAEAGAEYREDLTELLDELRAADPDVEIVVVGLYSPFSLGTATDFEVGADDAVSELNAVAERVADSRGALFVEVQGHFEARADSLTLMSEAPADIHPSPLGHDVLAARVLDLLAAEPSR